MATTYTELKAEIAAWLNRADLTARIPTFVQLAEAQMNRRLRVQRMIQASAPTITANNDIVALPTGFLEVVTLRLTDGTNYYAPLPTTLEQIVGAQEEDTTAATPRYYAISGTSSGRELKLYPKPDIAYTAALTYYGKPTALSDSNATNWILAEAPDAYLYGSLLQAAPYLLDTEMAQVWSDGFTAALGALAAMDRTIVGALRTDVASLIPRHTFNINMGI